MDSLYFNPEFLTTLKHLAGGLGSLGAVLLSSEKGSFIVKGTKEAENELLAQLLTAEIASLAEGKFRAPALRYLPSGSDQCRGFIRQMSKLSADLNENAKMQVQQLAKTSGLQLMEFGSGAGLYTLSKEAKAAVLEETRQGPSGCKDSGLTALGAVLVYDLLINNWDRLPLAGIWTNNGNANNLLFILSKDQSAGCSLLVIDQAVTAILHQANRDKYTSQVAALCHGARAYAKGPPYKDAAAQDVALFEDTMQKLCEWIKKETGSDVGASGQKAISEGFSKTLMAVLAIGKSDFAKRLNKLGEQVVDMLSGEADAKNFKEVEAKNSGQDGKTTEGASAAAGAKPYWCVVCEQDLKSEQKLAKHQKSSLHKMRAEEQAAAQAAAASQPASKIPAGGSLRADLDFVLDVYTAMAGNSSA
eukprot:g48954.t1